MQTIEEARDAFNSIGCTNCHQQNGIAPPFDEIVSDFRAWSKQYPSIDDAVRANVEGYDNYDELIQTMLANVGKSLNDPEGQLLYSYFKSLFNETTEITTSPIQTTTKSSTSQGPNIILIATIGAIVSLIAISASYVLARTK